MAKPKKMVGFSPISFLYLVTGAILLIVTLQFSSVFLYVGSLGALSIVASYGLSTMRKWSIFLTTVVSLSGIAFGCTTAYAIYRMFNLGLTEIALLTAMLSYVALLIVSILWMALNKDKFR